MKYAIRLFVGITAFVQTACAQVGPMDARDIATTRVDDQRAMNPPEPLYPIAGTFIDTPAGMTAPTTFLWRYTLNPKARMPEYFAVCVERSV